MANVYDFRSGHSLKGLNPQQVGTELERIREDKGSLTPSIVLEEATSEDSPLHPAFDWDDVSAAHQHRLTQARRLIVSIRVLNSVDSTPTPAYVSVKTPDKGRNYVPFIEAMSDEELRLRVLVEARQAIEALERRYSKFTAVADLLENLKKRVG